MGARSVGFAVVAATMTACSLLVDTSGFIGGNDADGGSALDGATASDVTTNDAAPSSDAGGDADAAPFICPGVFCDSFDRPSEKYLDGWTMLEKDAPSEISIDPARGHAAPPALRTVVAAANNTGGAVGMYKAIDTSATTLRFAFSVRADANVNRHAHMAVITFGKPTAAWVLLLFPQQTNTVMLASQTPGASGMFSTVQQNLPWTINAWHRYDMTVTIGNAPKAVLLVDGAKIYDGALPYPLVAPTFVSIGPNYTQAGSRIELWYDDVVLDLK